jgi:hypothetical protein
VFPIERDNGFFPMCRKPKAHEPRCPLRDADTLCLQRIWPHAQYFSAWFIRVSASASLITG